MVIDGVGITAIVAARRHDAGTLPPMEVPESVEVRQGEEVVLSWPDGSATVLSARTLRAGCKCATCREPAGMRATVAVLEGDAAIRIADARLVGTYAVSFRFEPDGHDTGIFSFDLLRALGEP
jgi:DUF971 family protein